MKNIKYLVLGVVAIFVAASGNSADKEPLEEKIPKDSIELTPDQRTCMKARLGLQKHGGQILFTNPGNTCFMMTAMQTFLHSDAIFDALCELEASRLKEGSLTFLVHKLFTEAFDPDRDSSKPYDASWFANNMKKPLLDRDYTCEMGDPAQFLQDLMLSLGRENKDSALVNAFLIRYDDTFPTVMSWHSQGGNNIVEKLNKHFTRFPVSSPPGVIFARVGIKRETKADGTEIIPADGLLKRFTISGLGNYRLVGVTIGKGPHYTASVKNLRSGQWESINSLGSTIKPVEFKDVISNINEEGAFIPVVVLQRADYKRHRS